MNGLWGVKREFESVWPLLRWFTKFVATWTWVNWLKLSSSHPYQPLVLISTAQCITGLRRKRLFAEHSKEDPHHRYIDLHGIYRTAVYGIGIPAQSAVAVRVGSRPVRSGSAQSGDRWVQRVYGGCSFSHTYVFPAPTHTVITKRRGMITF